MADTEHPSRRLSDLTSPDVETALESGVDTVILPLGATEQHGPHLPLGTDTTLAMALADRVERRLGDTLVAPAIPVGPSEEHTAFPGTISISSGTLASLVRDYVDSFEKQGFGRVIVLPAHGGCFPAVGALYPDLARESTLDIVAFADLRQYLETLSAGLDAAGLDVDEPVAHAGASETAMMLALCSEAVADDLPKGHTGPVSATVLYSEGVESYAENGVLGDARPATAAAGETLLDHVADAFTAHVREKFASLAD